MSNRQAGAHALRRDAGLPSDRLQLMRSMAAMPVADQLERIKPSMPLQRLAVQKEEDKPRGTVYVGINTGAEKELGALEDSMNGAEGLALKGVMDDPNSEGANGLDGVADLEDPYAIGNEAALAKSMGIAETDELFAQVVEWLEESGPVIKDTVAGVINAFLGAQRGEYSLSRLVLSGHSDGDSIFGEAETAGGYEIVEMLRHARMLFPGVFPEVEDVMLSACFCGHPALVAEFVDLFPNLETVWAYANFSPSAKSGGSLKDLAKWEKATRGEGGLTEGSGRPYQVLWRKGDAAKKVPPLGDAVATAEAWIADNWDAYYTGARNGDDDEHRDFYRVLQRITYHPDLDESQRVLWKSRRDVTLRLRKFGYVSYNYFSENAETLTIVFGSERYLELNYGVYRAELPDLIAELSALVSDVESGGAAPDGAATETWLPVARAVLAFLEGPLTTLDPEHIPVWWCG